MTAFTLTFVTVVFVLLAIGLLVLAKIVLSLRDEVRQLKAKQDGPVMAPAPVVASVPVPETKPPVVEAGIPADVYSAIVSAVYIALGDEPRILAIMPDDSMAWSREGRRSIFGSHTFR